MDASGVFCQICRDFVSKMNECADYRINGHPGARLTEEGIWLDKLIAHTRTPACRLNKKSSTHIGNGTYSGPFAFTLTKSPRDPYSVGDMLTAVRKVLQQKSVPVTRYAWYYEDKGRDENGDPIHPHVHGMYETANGGRIETKHFKRAWPIWDPSKPLGAGFHGGYHRPVKSEEKYDDYIKKDGGMGESAGQ